MASHPKTLQPFQSLVVVAGLVVVVFFGKVKLVTADINTIQSDAREMCKRPTNVTCLLQPNPESESCKVTLLPKENCFEKWPGCIQENYTFIENKDFIQQFDQEKNITVLTIYNQTERILLLRTNFDDDSWLQLELPSGKHNITVTDIPGRLREKDPIVKTVFCEECPPPRISWVAYRALHLFQIVVSSLNARSQHIPSIVEVRISSTNQTDLDIKDCESPYFNKTAKTSGRMNEVMTVDGMYSKTHCILIYVDFSSTLKRRYRCLEYMDMTGTP